MPGMLLADMGAQVIRVETRNRLDVLRYQGPALGMERAETSEDLLDMRAGFHAHNRNKLGITLDLSTPEGREMVAELIKISDVVVDNFGIGVTRKLGLDYHVLQTIRPDIIALSITMVGHSGPWNETRAYAPNMAGLSGLTTLLGYHDEPEPQLNLGLTGDVNAGETGALALLLALAHRQRTGQGQFIDLSAVESTIWLLGEPIMDYFMNGRVAGRQGNYHPVLVPHGTYPCQGEDKWVSIAVDNEEEWHHFCQATGNTQWANDDRFLDKYSRLKHREELDSLIGEWTKGYTRGQVTELLQQAGVAAMPVLDPGERYQDAHFKERGLFVEIEHSKSGPVILYGNPWRLSETPAQIRFPAPNVGQHDGFVFEQLLGMPTQ